MVRAELTFKQFSVLANKSLFASAWYALPGLLGQNSGSFSRVDFRMT